MTYKEIKGIVEEIGLPYAYDHFAEGDSPDAPSLFSYFRTGMTSLLTTNPTSK